jgi:hypothetical protein
MNRSKLPIILQTLIQCINRELARKDQCLKKTLLEQAVREQKISFYHAPEATKIKTTLQGGCPSKAVHCTTNQEGKRGVCCDSNNMVFPRIGGNKKTSCWSEPSRAAQGTTDNRLGGTRRAIRNIIFL